MNRLKNYGLWVAIFAFLPLLLEGLGVDALPENYEVLVKSFLGVLVMAGILNNPSNGTGFKDVK